MKLKQISKRTLSVVLSVLMVLTTLIVGTITVSAFDLQGTYNFDNYTAKWDNVYLVKVGNDGVYTEYSQMSKGSNGIYTYNLGNWGGTSFYFANSNSNPTATTQKFTVAVDSTNNCFVPSSATGTDITGTWTTTDAAIAAHHEVEPTTAPQTTPTGSSDPTEAPTQPTTSAPSGDNVVYCQNDAGWSSVNCYMWNDANSSIKNHAWPGVAMKNLGDGLWSCDVDNSQYDMIIFNDGSTQTDDMSYPGAGYVYNNKNNTWEVYDGNPLRITSFTTDLASPQYTGMDITVTANAKNSDGSAVSYKFSVTNTATNQTIVLSNFGSANSVVWTPTAVGDYVITLDVKDTSGNENQRTMNYSVADPTSLVKPLIMAVKPGNNGQIQVNTSATVNVKAGGGNTGTKLLFYKYVVTDPDGVKNTPYYSLSSTYQLTPTKLGTYKVQVYVQGSDNQTVNKTYTYSSVSQIETSPSTVAPTTVAPTTVAPTTVAPTTVPPTTVAPTTVAPTTAPPTTAPVSILGDVNLDGNLDIRDATEIQFYLAELSEFTPQQLALADFNKDGEVTIQDATSIQIHIAEMM